jgi:hypothetical protein
MVSDGVTVTGFAVITSKTFIRRYLLAQSKLACLVDGERNSPSLRFHLNAFDPPRAGAFAISSGPKVVHCACQKKRIVFLVDSAS